MRDFVKLEGFVVVRQGKNVLARSRNHFVSGGLKALAAFLMMPDTAGYAFSDATMRVGTNTVTATAFSTVELTAKVDIAPDTLSSDLSPGSNYHEAKFTATWDAGVITDTIGEAGLYLYNLLETAQVLFSRLSVADDDFYPFTPAPALPLTVEWYVRFTFE